MLVREKTRTQAAEGAAEGAPCGGPPKVHLPHLRMSQKPSKSSIY
jgi:hypothetical protein